MRRAPWLQSSGLSLEVQQSIKDLPFNGSAQFADQTDFRLLGMKDSRATLHSLGIYTPLSTRQHFSNHRDSEANREQIPIIEGRTRDIGDVKASRWL